MQSYDEAKNHCAGIAVSFLLTVFASGSVFAQGVSVNASLTSEPQRHGLAEASGRPALAFDVDWELNEYFFVGASGYLASDAPAPHRPKNVAPFVGIHFGEPQGVQFDLLVMHRIFPGDFATDWDFTDVQLGIGFSPTFGVSFTATDDYYGMGMRSVSGAVEYVHNFSDRLYGRVKAGYVDIDNPVIDSFSFGVFGLGYRFSRFSVEGGFRANDAEQFRPFTEAQTRNRLMLTMNWLVY